MVAFSSWVGYQLLRLLFEFKTYFFEFFVPPNFSNLIQNGVQMTNNSPHSNFQIQNFSEIRRDSNFEISAPQEILDSWGYILDSTFMVTLLGVMPRCGLLLEVQQFNLFNSPQLASTKSGTPKSPKSAAEGERCGLDWVSRPRQECPGRRNIGSHFVPFVRYLEGVTTDITLITQM